MMPRAPRCTKGGSAVASDVYATLVPTLDGFYHLTSRAWETPAKSSHDGTGDAFMAVRLNADEDVSISMALPDASLAKVFAKNMSELEGAIQAWAFQCARPSPWDALGLQPAFDGSGYSHTAARMECFSRLLEVVRVLKVQLFGAGEGKSVTHPRKVTIMASLSQFVIGQVSKGFAGLDLRLMYKEATGYFHSRYTDALSKDRGLEEQADLLRESMLYLGYQCAVCGKHASCNLFCTNPACQYMVVSGTVKSIDLVKADWTGIPCDKDLYTRYAKDQSILASNERHH